MPKTTQKPEPDAAVVDDPILAENPTVTIAGTEYPLKRLGIQHAFRIVRVLGRGVSAFAGLEKNEETGEYNTEQVLQVLVAAMVVNEEEALRLIADVLNVERKELNDPERFPMDSIIDVLQALARHQDLRSFFARLMRLMESVPSMRT
jgi:hypothetical protein